jgi:GcrA cell cycle regulator
MEPSNWAPEHSGALHEYLALGMTYSEIARAINAKFGTHYSRNATISRVSGLAASSGRAIWRRYRSAALLRIV